jgi:tetratricopeptide (TPR) repeat protein
MRLRPPALRAQVLAQAARAWQAADEAERALDAIARAVALRPADMDLRMDRAELLAEAGRLWEAVDELDVVLERSPASALALAMRAAARRRLDAPELARDDVARALAADPRLAEAWLESGILNRQAGRLDAARRDWLQVLVLDEDGPAGDAARAQIEALETGAAAPR